jgi:hypothetical protein
MKILFHTSFALLLPAILVFSGCGDSTAPARVTGTLTLDGTPVANATLAFIPVSGERRSYGETDSQGRYELWFTGQLAGAVVGEHRIEIRTGSADTPSGEDVSAAETIPAKYNVESELTRTLKSGKQTLNFELTTN